MPKLGTTFNRKQHGFSGDPLFDRWRSIIKRCHDPKYKQFTRYGARGIFLCDEWRSDYLSFRQWVMENGITPDHDIHRKDNDGPYSPQNCVIILRAVHRTMRWEGKQITAFGETKSMTEWAKDARCSVTREAIGYRLRVAKLSPEKAITDPPTPKAFYNRQPNGRSAPV